MACQKSNTDKRINAYKIRIRRETEEMKPHE